MNADTHTGFYYHSDASAFGGVLKEPLDRIVSTNASVSLAQAGGFSSSRVDRFNMDGLVSFDSAHVSVSGSEHKPTLEHKDGGGWRTIATATVEGLNILEVVTADRIVAQVSVMHPRNDGPVEISFNGSQFVNLRVNGESLRPKLDRRLFGVEKDEGRDTEAGKAIPGVPRFSNLLRVAEQQYQEGASVRESLVERLGHRFAVPDPQSSLEKKGSALCSLVKEVESQAPAEGYGRLIHLPDFGNIFLGEILVNRFSVQLTMLRVEMGCMARGTLSAASAFSNGRTMP